MRTLSSSHSVSLGHTVRRGCPDEWVVKNPPASAGDAGDTSSISGLGRSPREGTGYLFQSFCLGNPVERRAWQATVHGVAKSRTWLSVHACTVKKLLNCINSSLPLIFHLYGPACYFWLHRFFHNGGPTSIYIISRNIQWCFPTPVPSVWTSPVSNFMSQWIWWTKLWQGCFWNCVLVLTGDMFAF